MADYIRVKILDLVAVRSIVTVFYRQVGKRKSAGESHDFPEALYVDSGSLQIAVDDVPISLESGQMILYAPGSIHRIREATSNGATVGIISFEIESSLLEMLYNRVLVLNAEQRKRFSELIQMGVGLYEMAEKSGRAGMQPRSDADPEELQKLKNLLELFLLHLHRENTTTKRPSGSNQEHYDERQMNTLTEFLLAHLGETLSLEEMANAVGISVSKLRRLVHAQQGEGVNSYFLNLKIREARRLIRETSLNMTEIAEQLGFCSLHYFSRQFKNRVGKTPTEYAKSIDW